MKYYLSTFAGSAICGGFAFGIWPELWKTYGLMGGWLAATLIIGIMWYMNHYNGAILNPPGKIWLDQGWCIGSAGIAWGIVRFQGDITNFFYAVPTLVCCLIGGALAGIVVWKIRSCDCARKENTMSEWLQTYNEMFGMYHAGIITTIFGAFAVTFTVLMSWPKLVKDFGPIGGFMAAALIIGTFWLVNHKLPGFGFSTGLLNDADGLPMQFSLIHQGNRGSAPWVDMGWAIAMGFIFADVLCAPKGTRGGLLKEAFPRWVVIILGGIVGGIFVGLTGYTNAAL